MTSQAEVGGESARRVELRLAQAPSFDAFDIWHASLASMFFDVSLQGDRASFSGEFVGSHLGDALVFNSGSMGHVHQRLRPMVRSTGMDHVMIEVQTLGTRVGQFDDTSVDIRPGDVSFLDFGRTLRLKESRFRHLSLIVPRDRLPPALRQRNLHGLVLRRGTGGAALLSRYLGALIATADRLSPAAGAAATDAALRLAGTIVGELDLADLPEEGSQTLHQMARSYIDDHMADAGLTPERIAAALHLSRSALYRLFAADGGVQSYVLARRLDRSFDEIGRGRAASIAEIAFSHGFNSESHFARAFRARFGMRPRDAREVSREVGPTGPAGGSALEQLTATLGWVRNLGSHAA